jgi:hypothetical protein
LKSQNSSRKNLESDEKNGCGVKTKGWDSGDQIGTSALSHTWLEGTAHLVVVAAVFARA